MEFLLLYIIIALIISHFLMPKENHTQKEVVVRFVFDRECSEQDDKKEWVMATKECDKCEGKGSVPDSSDIEMILCDKCCGAKVMPIFNGLDKMIIPVNFRRNSDIVINLK